MPNKRIYAWTKIVNVKNSLLSMHEKWTAKYSTENNFKNWDCLKVNCSLHHISVVWRNRIWLLRNTFNKVPFFNGQLPKISLKTIKVATLNISSSKTTNNILWLPKNVSHTQPLEKLHILITQTRIKTHLKIPLSHTSSPKTFLKIKFREIKLKNFAHLPSQNNGNVRRKTEFPFVGIAGGNAHEIKYFKMGFWEQVRCEHYKTSYADSNNVLILLHISKERKVIKGDSFSFIAYSWHWTTIRCSCCVLLCPKLKFYFMLICFSKRQCWRTVVWIFETYMPLNSTYIYLFAFSVLKLVFQLCCLSLQLKCFANYLKFM